MIDVFTNRKAEVSVKHVLIYKINNHSMSPIEKMEVNIKVVNFVNQKKVEVLGIYEDDIRTPLSKREGLKQVIADYKKHYIAGQENIDYLESLKVLISVGIGELAESIFKSLEILDYILEECEVHFIP